MEDTCMAAPTAQPSWANVVKSSKQGRVGYNYPTFHLMMTLLGLPKMMFRIVVRNGRTLVGIVLGFNPFFLAMKNFVDAK